MKLAAVCILQLLVDAGIRQSWDSIVDTLSRPQVWQLRNHSLVPGRGRDFSLLQIAHASSASHPALLFSGHGCGLAWSRPFMSIYCSAEFECVWSWSFTHLNACMARTRITLQIPDCNENTELDSYLKSGFYTLIGCCIFLWVCMNASSFQCHKVWSCLDDVGT